MDRGAGDACAHACREGGHRILDVVDMVVMMDMMVDVTRGCLYTTHACREGGHRILDVVDMNDGHDGHDGGHDGHYRHDGGGY